MSIFSRAKTAPCACADQVLSNGVIQNAILENAKKGYDRGWMPVEHYPCLSSDKTKRIKYNLGEVGDCLSKRTGMTIKIHDNYSISYSTPTQAD